MTRCALLLGFGTLLFVNFVRLHEVPTIEGSGDDVDYPDDYDEIGSGLVLNLSSIDANNWRARRSGTVKGVKSGQPGKNGKKRIWKELRREMKDIQKFLPNLASNLSFMELDVRDINRNFFSIAGDIRFVKNEVMYIKRQAHVIWENVTDTRRDHKRMNKTLWWILGNVTRVIDEVDKTSKEVTDMTQNYGSMASELSEAIHNVADVSTLTNDLRDMSSEFGEIKTSLDYGSTKMTTELHVVRDIVSHLSQTVVDIKDTVVEGFEHVDYEINGAQSRILANMSGGMLLSITNDVAEIGNNQMEFTGRINEVSNLIRSMGSHMDQVGSSILDVENQMHEFHGNVGQVNEKITNVDYKVGDVGRQLEDMGHHMDAVGTQFIGFLGTVNDNFNKVHSRLGDVHNTIVSNVSSVRGDLDNMKVQLKDIRKVIAEKCEGSCKISQPPDEIGGGELPHDVDYPEWTHSMEDQITVTTEHAGVKPQPTQIPSYPSNGVDVDHPEMFPHYPEHPSNGYPSNGHPSNGYPPDGHPSNGYPTNGYPSNGYPPDEHPSNGYPTNGYPSNGYPPDGHPSNGYPTNGYPTNGYPTNGYPTNGYPTNGYPTNGYPTNGYPTNGYPTNGYPTNGYPTNGHPSNGYPPNGHPSNGFPSNGYPSNGVPPNGHPSNGFPPSGHPSNGFPPSGHPSNGFPPSGHPSNGFPPSGHPSNGFPPSGQPPAEATTAYPYPFPPSSTYAPTLMPGYPYPVITTSVYPPIYPPSSTYAPTPTPGYPYPTIPTVAYPPVHYPTTTYAPPPIPGHPIPYPPPVGPPAYPHPPIPTYPSEYPHSSTPPTYPQPPIWTEYPPHVTTPQVYPVEYPHAPILPDSPAYPPHPTMPPAYPPRPGIDEIPVSPEDPSYPTAGIPGIPLPPGVSIQLPQGPHGPGLPIGCGDEFTGFCACVCPCDCTCPVFNPTQSAMQQTRYHRFPYIRKTCQCLCSCPCRDPAILDGRPMVSPIEPPAATTSHYKPLFEPPPPGPSVTYAPGLLFEDLPDPAKPSTTQSPTNGEVPTPVPVPPTPLPPDGSEIVNCCDQLMEHISSEISWAVGAVDSHLKVRLKDLKDDVYEFFDGVLRFHIDVSNLAEHLKHQLAMAVAGVVSTMNTILAKLQERFHAVSDPFFKSDDGDDRSPAIRPPARPPVYRPGINPPEFTPPGQYPAYVPTKPHGRPPGRPQLVSPQHIPYRPPSRPQSPQGQFLGYPNARPPSNLPARPQARPPTWSTTRSPTWLSTRPQRISTISPQGRPSERPFGRPKSRPSRKPKYQEQSSPQSTYQLSGSLRQLAQNNPQPESTQTSSSLITTTTLSNETIITTTDVSKLTDVGRRSLPIGNNNNERSTKLLKTTSRKKKKKKKNKGCINRRKTMAAKSHFLKLSQIRETDLEDTDANDIMKYEDDDELSHGDDTHDIQAKPDGPMKTPGTELAITDKDLGIIGTQTDIFAFNNMLQEHMNNQLMTAVQPHSGYGTKRKRRPSRSRRGRGRNRYKLRPRPLFPMIPGFPFIQPPMGLRPPMPPIPPIPIPMTPIRIPTHLAIRPPPMPDLFGSLPPGTMVAGINGSPYSLSYSDGRGNSWNVNVNRRNYDAASGIKPEELKASNGQLELQDADTQEDTEEEQDETQEQKNNNDSDESLENIDV